MVVRAPIATIVVLATSLLCGCFAGPHPQYFDSDGVKLAYTVQSAGLPLVLTHGYQGTGAVHWQLPGTADRLARFFVGAARQR